MPHALAMRYFRRTRRYGTVGQNTELNVDLSFFRSNSFGANRIPSMYCPIWRSSEGVAASMYNPDDDDDADN